MGKLEDNKKIKREAILDAAFLLLILPQQQVWQKALFTCILKISMT